MDVIHESYIDIHNSRLVSRAGKEKCYNRLLLPTSCPDLGTPNKNLELLGRLEHHTCRLKEKLMLVRRTNPPFLPLYPPKTDEASNIVDSELVDRHAIDF
ncbi:hypothetical protein TWF102_001985 [Orbilia oligospora]|uniref:Uncharacterized protein n=1 Tax=Orbilia oligospora TaxID=2813651 RepID=A0A7C8N3K0_ORBOL|nr:hypothetical protein TWF102_001985 [Orbilia oligospora]KAF3084407.1 hypothetical protein TWF103_002549 [Orbilia oligospora]KAF3108337.1 hypothetical protein TWF706_002225 [Orbilia oligospora]